MTDPPGTPTADAAPRRPAAVRWLEAAELAVGVGLLAVIFALTLTQALQRHLPMDGWVWTGELARLGLVWLTFALAGYLLGSGGHVTLQVADFLLKGRALRTVWIFANLTVAAVCVAFTREAAELVFSGSPQSTPALGIPVAWTYAIPLGGLALTALRGVLNAFLPCPVQDEPDDTDTPEKRPA